MARPVILGNGSLTVGLNEFGLVHDFYYPYVGLDNLVTSRRVNHKIGVWVGKEFSWVDDHTWEIDVDFEADALISSICMRNKHLEVELRQQDFVDYELNAFCRSVVVHNLAAEPREIRVFFHQVFRISRDGRADTALFVPEDNYLLDYKGRCCLLIYGQHQDGQVYDQFAVGNYAIEGKEGTYRDAEDGELSGSAVEHGGVDSVLRFRLELDSHAESSLQYWIVAADSQYAADRIHQQIKKEGLAERINENRFYWHKWLSIGANKLHAVDKAHLEITKKSLLTIKAHIDQRGGVIASCDSSIYNYGRDYYSYVWPRDGAYVLWPLIRLGYSEEPRRFFEFCRDILSEDGYLMHKYQPDRAIGSTWHPLLHKSRKELAIQEDETAIAIYMLGEYHAHVHDEDFVRNLYTTLIQPAANFMASYIDEQTRLPHASYDLWEEKFLTTTYTTAVVYQALLVAADFADAFEYPDDSVHWRRKAEAILASAQVFYDVECGAYRKGYLLNESGSLEFDNTLDVSSFYGVMMFGLHDEHAKELHATAKLIEKELLDKSPSGGAPRYEYDQYFASKPAYLGNPWFVTTLWMAQYYIRTQQPAKARTCLEWSVDHALPSGVLSEQVNPTDGRHVSVTPLVWSHAELVNSVLDLARLD